MKNIEPNPFKTTTKANFRLLPVIALILSSLVLSACQKEPEPEPVVTTEGQTTAVTTSIDDQQKADELAKQQADDLATQHEREIDLSALEEQGAVIDSDNANTEALAVNPEQAVKGTQITDVTYRSATGENLSVVFETSATGVLNAIVTLPNKPKMTLSAPEGQGNNPTYRSQDGNIELISHGGGSSMDLMRNGKLTSYEATSAEAEVVTQ